MKRITLYQGVKLDDGYYGVRNIKTNELMEVFKDYRPGMDASACDWTEHMHNARNTAASMNDELNEQKAEALRPKDHKATFALKIDKAEQEAEDLPDVDEADDVLEVDDESSPLPVEESEEAKKEDVVDEFEKLEEQRDQPQGKRKPRTPGKKRPKADTK